MTTRKITVFSLYLFLFIFGQHFYGLGNAIPQPFQFSHHAKKIQTKDFSKLGQVIDIDENTQDDEHLEKSKPQDFLFLQYDVNPQFAHQLCWMAYETVRAKIYDSHSSASISSFYLVYSSLRI